MLLSLKITNFAIIESLSVDFASGFTVLTGETGAGKSIIIDALCLALGSRASTEVIRAGAEYASVQAIFDISGHPLVQARLREQDLVGDDPEMLIVRRLVGQKNKTKIFINDIVVTLATLVDIMQGLVEISGQHEQQSLLSVEQHILLLDSYADLGAVKAAYQEAYTHLKNLQREEELLAAKRLALANEQDFLQFQLTEIQQAAPQLGEDLALEAERQRLLHVTKLKSGVYKTLELLNGEEAAILDRLRLVVQELGSLAKLDPTLTPSFEHLTSWGLELRETVKFLERYTTQLEAEPERLEQIEARLTLLKRLAKKHGGDLEQVLAKETELQAKLQQYSEFSQREEDLEGALQAAYLKTWQLAQSLRVKRLAAATAFSKEILAELNDMELKAARLEVVIQTVEEATLPLVDALPKLTPLGLERVELFWSANAGEPLKPLLKIASGGELSRLMLAIKRVLATRDLVSLYIFDELDTGLGGKAAAKIGAKLQSVAKEHQIIVITHLAQIAARADQHLVICKEEYLDEQQQKRTTSSLKLVEGAARELEIARMIAGDNLTRDTQAAAAAMLKRAKVIKVLAPLDGLAVSELG